MTHLSKASADTHRYHWEQTEGKIAKPGSKCPYTINQPGKRCAWLAGHLDEYGPLAWERARQ